MQIISRGRVGLALWLALALFLPACSGGGHDHYTGGGGAAPDAVSPVVTFTTPADGDTDVAINVPIAAAFSEAMDPATITDATFTLTGPGGAPVDGTVASYGGLAAFTPDQDLAAGTLYTATITTGCRDLAGNPILADHTWSFTTSVVGDTTAPTVTSTDPVHGDTDVALNSKVAATFSEFMLPNTINNDTFQLTGPGLTPVAGTVTWLGLTATFTPASPLLADTVYTGTITTGARDLAGNPLPADYRWSFTTGAAPDTTPPTVTFTDPANAATDVPTNKRIAATFSEGMDPATIDASTFILTGPGLTPVLGLVTYVGQTATFIPSSDLAGNTLYTATLTTRARDLAGNQMAANHTWTFTTGAAPDTTPPTVISTNPLNGEIDVQLNKKITVTFSEGMDPLTMTNTTFTVTGVPGIVTYDAVSRTATFRPASNLATNTVFQAKVSTAAKDLAGNRLAADHIWTFTTGIRIVPEPVPLGFIAPFGSFGDGAGMTNQGVLTVINGDIGTTGASTSITGFHDSLGNIYTETPLNVGFVTGIIYTATAPPGSTIAQQGALSAQTAYNNLTPAALPGGIHLGTSELGGLTLAPGIYESESGSYQITGSDLTLDARGDPDAVWVFQMATSLTVGGPGAAFPRNVILANGALPKNVFWQVGSAATINAAGGGTMVGTILAVAGVTISTAGNVDIATLNGRALGLNAAVTMVNTHINIPAP